ncbi:MAG TPA: N-acetylmuramoyl-L-alanine amidase [Planctomycetota bacterium]|nr:N-acetylmuramoyl-L-alanine amidase [Planctomycetota bacterium]
MKRVLLFMGSALSLMLITGLVAADTKVSYVTLNQLAQKYNLKHEKDDLTGREMFSGNGYNLIASRGMTSIMVNNKFTVLEQKLKSINGQLALSTGDFSKVETLMTEPHRKEISVRAKGVIRKVVIDPGHGGDFRGCKGRNGLCEKDVNLDVAKRLRALFEEKDVKVVLTRTTDRPLSANLNEDLSSRVDVGNREQPDLFISIHCNWSNNAAVKGFEIFYSPENNVMPSLSSRAIGDDKPGDRQTQKALTYILKDEYSRRTVEIARAIQKQFNKLPTEDRGIKKANFKVVKYSEIPSILVEMGFLSNKSEAANFHKDSYRQEVAERIRDAVISYQSE